MGNDPIRGKTFRWTFNDGQMKGRTFDHTFGPDGTVKFGCTDGTMNGEGKYEYSQVNPDVYAVSYHVDKGYTLTTVMDTKSHQIVSFSSNDKELQVQHGTYEPVR
jgi:hypothetical protein